MTKTTAEVKRYKHFECSCNDCMIVSETGAFVLATDYDILQQRFRELEECVRELVEFTNESCRHCGNETCLSCLAWQDRVIKLAQSLLGGEKGVGT